MVNPVFQQIISDLEGSCSSLEQVAAYYGIDDPYLDKELTAYIDNSILCCETCGWWCGVS